MDEISISSVVVGKRRRTELGDIEGLAASIVKRGLIHPIVVDENDELIAGERRLRACQALGRTTIYARRFKDLSDAEKREIELDENVQRKDLTSYERSKDMVVRAVVSAEILRDQAAEPEETADWLGTEEATADGSDELFTEPVNNSVGRPEKTDSVEKVAERIGASRQTVVDAQQHVATVDTYLPSSGKSWTQSQVLQARRSLNLLPDSERPAVSALVDVSETNPKEVLDVLKAICASSPADRATIVGEYGARSDRWEALRSALIGPREETRPVERNGSEKAKKPTVPTCKGCGRVCGWCEANIRDGLRR